MLVFAMPALMALASLSSASPPPSWDVGTLSGRVTSTSGAPLGEVRIEVVGVHRSSTSGPDGRYRIAQLAAGRYSVTFARVGFAPVVRVVSMAGEDLTLDLTMKESAIELAPIQVTASPLATTALTSPQPLSVVGGEDLHTALRPSLGETLEGQPGLRNLSTGSGIGKPVIRGLTSNRVLVLADGQRMENQQWGDEHGPQVETSDAARIEVIRGPASVLYGSDALGGVINVVPRALPDAIGRPGLVRTGLSAGWSTNAREPEGTLVTEGATGGFGFRASLAGRRGRDVRTSEGLLANSGAETYNGTAAAGVRGGWGAISATYTHREERIEIHEDPAEAPDFSGFQRIGADRAQVTVSLPTGAGTRLETKLGYERNRRREFEDAESSDVALGLLSRAWTGDARLHHTVFGQLAGTLGLATGRTTFDKFGEETLIPNTTTNNVGLYLFEQTTRGRWHLSAGARYDYRHLAVEDDADLGLLAQTRSWNSLTGNAGVLYSIAEPVALVVNLGRGFRAPSSFDLFSNGVHEGTVAFERGNAGLRNETSFNVDVALRVQANRVRLEIGGFVNAINEFIYTRPTGTFDPGSGFEIFDVVQGDARLTGVETAVDFHPTGGLHFKTGLDFVRGQNQTTDTPLAFIAPIRWTVSARLEGKESRGPVTRPWIQLGGETNGRQTRLDPNDVAPPGYTLGSLSGGLGLKVGTQEVDLDVSVRNLFDTRYTNFLSRYKRYALSPGRNLTVRLSVGM